MREVFPDLAVQGLWEMLDRGYATGEAYRVEALPLRLAGENYDRFFDFTYQPIRNADGAITGIFVGGYDTTSVIRTKVYADALVKITDVIGSLTDPDAVSIAAATVLGETLGVSRVGYGTIDPVSETLHVEQDWTAAGVESLAGITPLREYGAFIDSLKRGEFISIDDVRTDERTSAAAAALQERSASSFVNVPVIEKERLVAVLYINHHAVRRWLPEELFFVREAASRIRAAVERSRNEVALRDFNASLQDRIDAALREQAATEEALRQAQKMEAVGQLTGGLAHDFNNLLTGMMGNLELLQMRVARGRLDDLDRFINAAQGAGRRAASLTQRLLAFSRRQTLDPKPTDVNRLIAGLDDMLRRTVGATIDIETVGAAGLWNASIDASQLENAILNLCINGRDAMPEGGRLTIETANKWIDDRTGRERDLAPGQYISVCVTDTGTGMSPQTIQRAFEPFYTTKPIGQGTGLGLSMIYGFAKQSGGQVRIYSEVGQGTTVCIYLPREHGDVVEHDDGGVPTLVASVQAQTVLVVDDEATIRHIIDEVLDDLGYTVIGAADGAAGIKVLQSGAKIELLITDVGLPNGMNGRQVADAARALRPGLKVLFITGFAENAAVGNGHMEPGMELLTKPFSLEALTTKVAEMLKTPTP